jgi:PAS domain S-box-containing protein
LRRDGDQLLYLNELRHQPDSAAKLRAAVATTTLLGAQVLRGEVQPGSPIEGVDYRGVPVLGVAGAVTGTDWVLVAKIDRAELFGGAWQDALWTALAALLTLLITAAAAHALNQRRSLAAAMHERKVAAEKLRALQLLDAIAEGSEEGMFVKDTEGRYLLFNRAACEMVGKTQEEVLGGDDTALFSAEDAARVMASDREVRAANQTLTAEQTLTTHKGPRVYLITKGPLRDATGAVMGIFGISRDITERNRNDELLRMLSQAVEQSPESIVITDVDASIQYVNAAFTRNTGYSRDEAIGQNPKILNSGNTSPETFAAMWQALAQGQPWRGEFSNRRKDGSEYIEFAIITPIRQPDGRISHYVAVKDDITDRKRLGQELDQHRHHLAEMVASRTVQLEEARERADIANRTKSAFLANMSHEIRTPMNAIVGLTHLLRRSKPTPEQADRLDKIAAATEHLLTIINDILDLSKIEAGKLALEQNELSLAAILDNARSMIAEQARLKGLALKVECAGVPLWLWGDPTRLRQALLNFASNAVKFTEHGTITLRAGLLENRGDEVMIRFEVVDTGIGIAAEKLPNLFQPFVQADVSSTRVHGGTGLGLAITRRLAYLMGGDAGVESEVGRGSTFWFTARLGRHHGLPSATPAANGGADDGAEAELRRHHAGARILMAEDNRVNREMAIELLEAAGLAADIAVNGHEAVAMAAAASYDLILMDVRMPLMNGLDATRAIRRQPGGATPPILALTANAFDEDRLACQEAGMNDFVAKPMDPAQFYAALLKWLPAAATQPATASAEATTAPSGDEAEPMRRLAGIPGLDLTCGLATMRGNTIKYMKLLSLFADGYQPRTDQIAGMLASAEFDSIEAVAHSLRGSAAMLGALKVADAASALLDALRDGEAEAIGLACAAMADEMSRLVAGIRRADAPSVAIAETNVDTRRCAEVLARLAALLEQGDIAASYLARDEAGLLHAALGGATPLLLARIEAFDYEGAAAQLRGLAEGDAETGA